MDPDTVQALSTTSLGSACAVCLQQLGVVDSPELAAVLAALLSIFGHLAVQKVKAWAAQRKADKLARPLPPPPVAP